MKDQPDFSAPGITRRDLLKTVGAVAAGAALGVGLGETLPESQAQASGNGGGQSPSVLSLPKGGGAIQGIGESFQVNPFSGSGNFSFSIGSVSQGRAGFGPELSLQYSTAQGNSPFGLGWSLSLPQISRKTEKGIPQYQGNDTFLLSGAEDLVLHDDCIPDDITFPGWRIFRFRPRIEGLWARCEFFERVASTDRVGLSDSFWRITTKENITNFYGRTKNAVLEHPEKPGQHFQWFLQLTVDQGSSTEARGQYIHYEYAKDTGAALPPMLFEEHRIRQQQQQAKEHRDPRAWQVYLKRIRYGNLTPLPQQNMGSIDALLLWMEGLDGDSSKRAPLQPYDHFFEVVFDYGEHGDLEVISVPENHEDKTTDVLQETVEARSHHIITKDIYDAKYPWAYREDSYSTYRAGFEVRTRRMCQRVLMFHHIPHKANAEESTPVLVKSTDFHYATDPYTKVSFLKSVTQRGYRKDVHLDHEWYESEELGLDGFDRPGVKSRDYRIASYPPVEFDYTSFQPERREWKDLIVEDTHQDFPNLADTTTALVDLEGIGLPSVVMSAGGQWKYFKNFGDGSFSGSLPLKDVPSGVSLDQSGVRWGAFSGSGLPDLVVDGSNGMGRYYERSHQGGWKRPHFFKRQISHSLSDPNIQLFDGTGDGLADAWRLDEKGFTFYECLGEEGFAKGQVISRAQNPQDFPAGPLNDPRIKLADMTGDGLLDFVIIEGGVRYFPNLGYGRFGPSVRMANPPNFGIKVDHQRIYFADITGSGPSDCLAIGPDGTLRYWINESGNGWSQPRDIPGVGSTLTNASSVQCLDLFGQGICGILLDVGIKRPGKSRYAYLSLSDTKPWLLTSMTNHASTTRVEYSTSTKEFLKDRAEERSWITTLPFPVHVVEKVTTSDHISRNRIMTRYAYHHGYYNGREREFRGFGMVEQFDTEVFEDFSRSTLHEDAENLANLNEAFHVPPTHTKTWFHTGLFYEDAITTPQGETFNAEHLLQQYRQEYYDKDSWAFQFATDEVLEPGVGATVPALHMAYRALRGSVLRTEVYALDGSDKEQHPYMVTESRYQIRKLQDPKPLDERRLQDGVFFPYKKETLTYHYERNPLDPRISHEIALIIDDFGGNVSSASLLYPRRPELQVTENGQVVEREEANRDLLLSPYNEQNQTRGTLTHQQFINPSKGAAFPNDAWFVGIPFEIQTFELHKLNWDWTCYAKGLIGEAGSACGYPYRQPLSETNLLALVMDDQGKPKTRLPFEDFHATIPDARLPMLRLIEWSQSYFRTNHEPEILTAPKNIDHRLPLGHIDSLALPFESYQAVFPQTFLNDQEVGFPFNDPKDSELLALLDKGGYVTLSPTGEGTRENHYWWIPSGRQAFSREKFYQPIQSQDPFGNSTALYYDGDPLPSEGTNSETKATTPSSPTEDDRKYWLLVQATKDPVGNIVKAVNDYVVLQPKEITDPNGNRSQVVFDALGLVVGSAVMGKKTDKAEDKEEKPEGDSLEGFTPYLTKEQLDELAKPDDPTNLARTVLSKASTRLIYDLWRPLRSVLEAGKQVATIQPAWVATLTREVHASVDAGPEFPIQFSVTYSDGFGREIQTKAQVEPGPLDLTDKKAPSIDKRWLGSGWTIFNNKGKPVQQFEPFFATDHTYTHAKTRGVSSTLLYDPLERVVATLHPNHTYEKVVFDPWCQETFDTNDTILCGRTVEAVNSLEALDPTEDKHVGKWFAKLAPSLFLPTWYHTRINEDLAKMKWPDRDEDGHPIPHHAPRRQSEKRAAQQTLAHAATPTITHLDTFGRAFLTVANNGVDLNGEPERLTTYTEFDIQGNDIKIRDPRGVDAFLHTVDMPGRKLAIQSVDAGPKWLVPDVTGNPIWSKDANGHEVKLEYDTLRRPTLTWVKVPNETEAYLAEAKVYGEAKGQETNHRGQLWKSYDGAGLVENQAYDFKGNLTHTTRIVLKDATQQVQWGFYKINDSSDITDLSATSSPIDQAYEDKKLDRNLSFTLTTKFDALNRVIERIEPDGITKKTPTYNTRNLLQSLEVTEATGVRKFVERVTYNEKGQRTHIVYGNKVQSRYLYDPETFRLSALITECREGKDHDRLQKRRHTYDPVGNIAHIHDGAMPAKWYDQAAITAESYYGYDPTYRLVLATGREHKANGYDLSSDVTAFKHSHFIPFSPPTTDGQALQMYTEAYNYDVGGNFIRVAHYRGETTNPTALLNQSPLWTRNQTVDWEQGKTYPGPSGPPRNNRLAFSRPGSSPPVPGQKPDMAYDANGNMIKLNNTLGTLQWDFKNQFIGVELNQAGDRAVYQYDGAGQRVRKWVKKSGTIEERIYLGEFEVFTRQSSTENVEWHVLHVMDDQARVALVETKVKFKGSPIQARPIYRYQLTNHLGSSVREVDETENANPISIEDYYPYGGTSYIAGKSETEVSLKRYRYSGKERDETGLYYYGARYYAPWMGRWLSADPAGLVDGVNLFAFVHNSPISGRDPTGKNTKKFGTEGDVNKHHSQGLRGTNPTTGTRALESEHIDPIALQRENMRNPATGKSPIPEGRGSAIDRHSPTVMLNKAISDIKTLEDKQLINRVKAEGSAGWVSPETASQLGPEAGLARTARAARQTGGVMPAGAQAAMVGQVDALHGDSDVRAFSRSTDNNPLENASQAEIDAAVDAPLQKNAQTAGDLTSLEVQKGKTSKTLFKGNYREVPASSGKWTRAGRHLKKAGKRALAAIPVVGSFVGHASSAQAAASGDITGAALDEFGNVPVAGDLVDAGRAGYAVGEAINELLPESVQNTIGGTISEIVNNGWDNVKNFFF